MIWIYLSLAFLAGSIWGTALTMYLIRRGIAKADITSDDRRFVKDVLGIPE